MPVSDQGLSTERYTVIPRTLIFVRRDDTMLMLKGAPNKRLWPGKYNGLGGHVEQGEDALGAALRELHEEAYVKADLRLLGTLLVDTGQSTGICVFIFGGEWKSGEPISSSEGLLEWVAVPQLLKLPMVEDLHAILPRILEMRKDAQPFSARSYYNEIDQLVVEFVDR